MPKVAIIGSASWGTALGIALARKGMQVRLWTRTEEEAQKMNRERENAAFLPGFRFPRCLAAASSIEEVFDGVALVILAVPAQSVRYNARLIRDYLNESVIVVNASKGLEVGTCKRMSQLITEELGQNLKSNICVLSGPNIAQEVVLGLYSAAVIAASDIAVTERARQIIESPCFSTFTTTDVIGVELGGALKNIVALATGMAEGLGYGDNAKTALITYGLAEITSLGVALGADPLTFSGLACLGDIVVTCFSPLGRNHHLGIELAKGHRLKDILSTTPHIAEGVTTTIAARQLGQKMAVDMPATEHVYQVLYEGVAPKVALADLMKCYARQSCRVAETKLAPSLVRHYL